MLKPRRENNDATRASTPGLSSTSTDRVWVWTFISAPRASARRSSGVPLVALVVEQRPDALGRLDLVVAHACGHHGPDLRIGADDEVDHHGPVVDRPRLVDDVLNVFGT